jgi:hypothetical protein
MSWKEHKAIFVLTRFYAHSAAAWSFLGRSASLRDGLRRKEQFSFDLFSRR